MWVWRDVDAWIHGTSVHACTCHSQVYSIYVNRFIYIYIHTYIIKDNVLMYLYDVYSKCIGSSKPIQFSQYACGTAMLGHWEKA